MFYSISSMPVLQMQVVLLAAVGTMFHFSSSDFVLQIVVWMRFEIDFNNLVYTHNICT